MENGTVHRRIFFAWGPDACCENDGARPSLQADENLFHSDGDKFFAANQGLAEKLREMIGKESPKVAERLAEGDINYLPMLAPWPKFTGKWTPQSFPVLSATSE